MCLLNQYITCQQEAQLKSLRVNMAIRQLSQIFFSPTGTTRQVLGAIAKGLSPAEIRGYDLTPPEKRERSNIMLTDEDDLVLLGVPVYEEHVPHFLWDDLNAIEGKGKAIVLVAVYGNIGFGMCLKELETWAVKAGFKVLAAAAFIAADGTTSAAGQRKILFPSP
jgi:flavodoxin